MAEDTKDTKQENTAQVIRTDMPVPMSYELIIVHGEDQFLVDPLDGVKLTRSTEGRPAKLDFKVPKDDVLEFVEGNVVQFSVNGELIFYGFVFEKDRDEDGTIRVLAYDQLRYLKNKDCYVYYDKTAKEVIQMIADDFGLTVDKDNLDNTQYKIPSRIEDNKELIGIIMIALALTELNTGKRYYLFDDAGKIKLKALEAMKTDFYIDEECLKGYRYRSSIDKDTYNMVKVVREAPGENGGKKWIKTGVIVDKDHVKEWGRLQLVLRPDEKVVDAIDRAKNKLVLKNRKTRDIRLKGIVGDTRIRGGSSVFVNLPLGDINLRSWYLVNNVTHTFTNGFHSMDLDLEYYEAPGKYEVTYDNDAAVLKQIQETKAAQKQQAQTPSGSYTYNGSADPGQVDTAFSACDGRVSPYGSVGCVDTVVAAGSWYNADLKALYDQGCADTGSLCSGLEARGYSVEPFNGYASKGDILLYGDRDHAVISDGVGGCFGNSSSNGYAMRYGDANYAWHNGEAPTEIIHMS